MKIRRTAAALMAVAVLATGTACNNANPGGASEPGGTAAPDAAAEQGAAAPEPVTLKGMLFNDPPKDLELVLAEFEQRTKDTLNTKLSIEWNPPSDHKQKVKLMMAAGEEVDFVFDADFMNLRELVPQGAYAELDKYFNNDEYPGLKKAFTPEMIEANKRNGHLYTIPFTQYFYDLDVIYIRKDLREKYGMEPIQSYEDLQAFYEKVLENEQGMTPLALNGRRGFYKIFGGETPYMPTVRPVAVAGWNFFVQLSDDLKKVENVVALGDPASEYAKLPSPYNAMKTAHPEHDKYAEWKKYLEKDVLSQKDAGGLFISGKAASNEGTLSGYAAVRKKVQETIPGADVEMFVYQTNVRNMEKGAIATSYRSNNSVAIPVTSKHIDRTMKFFDWIFSSRENHDLFEFGIQGKHWEPAGDDQVKLLDEAQNYNFPGYQLTWNPNFIRINADLDEEAKKYLEYSAKADTYFAPTLSRFVFDNTNVKAEFANMNTKIEPFLQVLKVGQFDNWEAEATKMHGELTALGLEKVREEIRTQVQAYLDNGGK